MAVPDQDLRHTHFPLPRPKSSVGNFPLSAWQRRQIDHRNLSFERIIAHTLHIHTHTVQYVQILAAWNPREISSDQFFVMPLTLYPLLLSVWFLRGVSCEKRIPKDARSMSFTFFANCSIEIFFCEPLWHFCFRLHWFSWDVNDSTFCQFVCIGANLAWNVIGITNIISELLWGEWKSWGDS